MRSMIEFLTSDPAIFLLSSMGLMVTAVSILRDTRTQNVRTTVRPLPTRETRPEKIAA